MRNILHQTALVLNRNFRLQHNLFTIKLQLHQVNHTIKIFLCEICSKEFARKDVLRRHNRFLHDRKQYQCDICFKEFARKDILRLHIRCAHDQKRYQCDNCLKEFTRKGDVLSHKKSIHTLCKPFTCEKYQKQFSKRIRYNLHSLSCSKCRNCLLQFNTITEFKDMLGRFRSRYF